VDLRFDFARRARIGLGEAVLCAGKSGQQIEHVIGLALARDTPLLLTRMSAAQFDALSPGCRARTDYDPRSGTAIAGPWQPAAGPPRVAVVSAGSSDIAVAHEAERTLAFYGEAAHAVHDVGVAGLWRLLEQEAELRHYPVLIAVAGMDGALFSVLGGLVGGLVIAVPTSTGYGAARHGRTALFSALTSCAPGIVAANIDNGYGAACAALRALRPPAAPA